MSTEAVEAAQNAYDKLVVDYEQKLKEAKLTLADVKWEALQEECKEFDVCTADTDNVAKTITEVIRLRDTSGKFQNNHLCNLCGCSADMLGSTNCEQNPFRFAIPPMSGAGEYLQEVTNVLCKLFPSIKWRGANDAGVTYIYANFDGEPKFY